MVKSLYTGVSGMKTHQQRMDVIGNNIANVNTTGYKTNVTTFADIYYQTKKTPSGATPSLGGTNPIQVGYGVKLNTTTPNMTQSGFTFSDSIYDMALDGEGFFQLMDGAGNILYTRAGIFNVDEEGNLVNASGYKVLGVSGEFDGQPAGSQPIKITIPATDDHCSSATKTINGCDVTISVSDPSDNTDMSVTFTDAEYPFATYSAGVLNLFFDRDQQFDSAQMFEDEIAKCLKAGGVTLPDDVSIKFTFENLPASTTSVTAKANVDSWTHALDQASVEKRVDVSGGAGTSFATIAFATSNANSANAYNSATIAVTAGTATTASYDQATNAWAITITDSTRQSDITQAIKDAIAAAKAADTTGDLAGLNLSVTKYEVPAGSLATAVAEWSALTLVNADPVVSNISATAGQPGEFANNYKIVFKYVSNYDSPTAQWDDNTLTIGITNKEYADDATALADINAAVAAAAGGNAKKLFTFDTGSFAGLSGLNPGQRKALFGDNPSLSFGGGEDSFYTTVAKSLSTFNLTDGRKGTEQSYKDLENVTIGQDGTIVGYHAVHGYINLGRIDIATFDNPNGLSAMGGTLFAETVASGEPKLAVAGSNGAGEVVSGALEMSNVDLAQEFTDMITTQRGYQANSRVITTSDTMLEELLSLKR
ncbi:MAG: flagellar hook-basal body complex protein [Oscillospiraceae bacterium]|nr:flagellar hook-basal body complex protein [Oscillospiraceae bacterium]